MQEQEEEDMEASSERCRRKGKARIISYRLNDNSIFDEGARNVERFLDLEAEVSQGDDDDDDDDGDMDGFIDNSHDFEGRWTDAAYEPLATQSIAQKNQDELREAEKLANSFNEKTGYKSRAERSEAASSQNGIVSSWVVHCKPRKEDRVIKYFLGCRRKDPSVQIRSYLRRRGDGYIHLDTAMPDRIGNSSDDVLLSSSYSPLMASNNKGFR
ncbi:hypothetical protein MPER_07519, partial [Moniliophthora perniciosa FA553]